MEKGLITKTQFAKKEELISRTTANKKQAIERKAQQNRLQGAANIAGAIADLAGKETAVGKAAAIAQTTINTYAGATAAFANPGGVWGAVLGGLIITQGLANVAQIMGIDTGGIAQAAAGIGAGVQQIAENTLVDDTPKAEKGALFQIGGQRHTQGGTKFYGQDGTHFEAAQGEIIGVMNRNAAQLFLQFNNAYQGYTPPILPARMETGGLIQPAGLDTRPIIQINQPNNDTLEKTLVNAFEAYGQPRT